MSLDTLLVTFVIILFICFASILFLLMLFLYKWYKCPPGNWAQLSVALAM